MFFSPVRSNIWQSELLTSRSESTEMKLLHGSLHRTPPKPSATNRLHSRRRPPTLQIEINESFKAAVVSRSGGFDVEMVRVTEMILIYYCLKTLFSYPYFRQDLYNPDTWVPIAVNHDVWKSWTKVPAIPRAAVGSLQHSRSSVRLVKGRRKGAQTVCDPRHLSYLLKWPSFIFWP